MANKRALFWKEWKNAKWMALVFSIICVICSVALNKKFNMIKSRYYIRNVIDYDFITQVYENNVLLLAMMPIGIIILVMLLFSDDRKLKASKFLSSLPFSRKEQFTVKYVVGLMTFTAPFILYSLFVIMVRLGNEKWISNLYKYSVFGEIIERQNSLGILIMGLGITWIIMLTMYSFLMFIQTLIGRNVIGGIMGTTLYFIPWPLMLLIWVRMSIIFNKPFDGFFDEFVDAMTFCFWGYPQYENVLLANEAQSLNGRWISYDTWGYEKFRIYIPILLMIITLSIFLARHFTETNKIEKTGYVFMNPWLGKILALVASILFLIIFPNLISIIVFIFVVMIISGIYVYPFNEENIMKMKKLNRKKAKNEK